MTTIGFGARKKKANPAGLLPEAEAFLRFDSGRAISFLDATRHCGVFGSNGTGKTYQGVVPAMESAIKAGAMILIADPKGTLAGYARAIAEACGRGGDVIEFGTTPASAPINLLEGMTPPQFFSFLMGLLRSYMDGGKSGNMDFHASSASCARDIFRMLVDIAKRARERGESFSATLPLILELMNSPLRATEIFGKYLRTVELTDEIRSFVQRIQQNTFHPLNQTETEPDAEHSRQANYNTQATIQALTGFLEESGIVEKFCRPGAKGFDIAALEGKIIILSFGAGAAGASALICRMALEAFYLWVYSQGVGGRLKFVIVDEFQEVCDLSSRRLSDISFIALAREFNCGFFLATQSYSALAARYGTAGLEALIANLNNKVFLHSEDVLTRDSASALGGPDLIDLQKEAFAATYDSRARNYVYGVETLNESYARTRAIAPLKGTPALLESAKLDAGDLDALLDSMLEEKMTKFERLPKPSKGDGNEATMTEYDKTVRDCLEIQPEREEMDKKDEILKPDDLRLVYARFFNKDAEISIPAGWHAFLARIFELYSGYGLKPRIRSIAISRGGFMEAVGEPSGAMRVLNNLLALSEGVCMRCGAEIESGKEVDKFGLCKNCLKLLPKIRAVKKSGRDRQIPF